MKRKVQIAVLSDLHLGTYGCHAKEVYNYLNSIDPEFLILNGDIIDIWAFKKKYFPIEHFMVIDAIAKIASKGTPVYYITGNHDDLLRRFSGLKVGSFRLEDKLVLVINKKKHWFFHGDVFDASIQHSKWIAKLGGKSYGMLIRINRAINWLLVRMGKEKMSFSKKIKHSVKKAVKFIGDFEHTAGELAIEKGYHYVICGHIHNPQIRTIQNSNGETVYMNSGDWVESLTALEYVDDEWSIYHYDEDQNNNHDMEEEISFKDKWSSEFNKNFVEDFVTSHFVPNFSSYENILRHSRNEKSPI